MTVRHLVLMTVVLLIAGGLFFLLVEVGKTAGVPDPKNDRLVALGKRLYTKHCAECHGNKLQGQPNWKSFKADGTLPAPPHNGTGHTWHHPDQVLFEYTKLGGQAVAPPGFKSAMPGFADTLSDSEIIYVLSYIKSVWPAEMLERQPKTP